MFTTRLRRFDLRRWLAQSSVRYTLLWGYLSGLCFFWAYVTATADLEVFSTFWAYVPRWIWALPFLAVAAVMRQSTVIERLPLLAGLVVVLGPVMGFSTPHWTASSAVSAMEPRDAPSGVRGRVGLRVLTVNMGSRQADPVALAGLVARVQPQLVLLQECSERADAAFEGAWHYRDDDALCVASRYPLRAAAAAYRPRRPQNDAFVAHYVVDVQGIPVDVVNLHLDTPRDAFVDAFDRRSVMHMGATLARRAQQVEGARAWIDARVDRRRALMAGDFNLTTDSAIYRRVWADFQNAFSDQGSGWGYTKRSGLFGARIDHVLAGEAWTVRGAWLESSIGSDHLPLVADMALATR